MYQEFLYSQGHEHALAFDCKHTSYRYCVASCAFFNAFNLQKVINKA